MQTMLGQTIGNYEIVSPFGEGGMGALYLGRHRTLAREVIIKTIRTEDFSPRQIEHLRQRLEREAYIQSQLDHPNIVRVYDFIASEEATCMVMEYVPGRDLRRMIARETGAIMPQRAVKLFKQVLRSIDYAHHFIYADKSGHKHQGIIHRDLKPANILITPNDIAKVTDFGIVKLRGVKGGTQMGFNPGTPEYMSPEQALGRELDHRSDIYALGVVFYEMLTGNVPFSDTGDGTSDYVIRRGHIEMSPPPLRQFKSDLSPELEAIVLRSLEKDPDARYQTARDFYVVLEEYERTGRADFSRVALPARHTLADDGRGTGVAIIDVATVGFGEQHTHVVSGLTEVRPSNAQLPYTNGAYTALERDGMGEHRRSPLPKVDNGTTSNMLTASVVAVLLLLTVGVLWWVFKGRVTPGEGGNPPPVPIVNVPPGMKAIPNGTFMMGRQVNDRKASEYEKPEHAVEIKAFYMDAEEVTNQQYAEYVGVKQVTPPSHWVNGVIPNGLDRFPVINVSWDDADNYCRFRQKRLPTEAEWEFAARGTKNLLYPYGTDWQPRFSSASPSPTQIGQLSVVGAYPDGKSPFGLLDMAGNVAEWTASDYEPYPGSKAKPDKGNKVMRGGSFINLPIEQTTTDRRWHLPTKTFDYVGFRCAKDP
jgi:serine/threonine-protein kinase